MAEYSVDINDETFVIEKKTYELILAFRLERYDLQRQIETIEHELCRVEEEIVGEWPTHTHGFPIPVDFWDGKSDR